MVMEGRNTPVAEHLLNVTRGLGGHLGVGFLLLVLLPLLRLFREPLPLSLLVRRRLFLNPFPFCLFSSSSSSILFFPPYPLCLCSVFFLLSLSLRFSCGSGSRSGSSSRKRAALAASAERELAAKMRQVRARSNYANFMGETLRRRKERQDTVRACVRACVRASVRACVRACLRACELGVCGCHVRCVCLCFVRTYDVHALDTRACVFFACCFVQFV